MKENISIIIHKYGDIIIFKIWLKKTTVKTILKLVTPDLAY